jgi:hypothetical protein
MIAIHHSAGQSIDLSESGLGIISIGNSEEKATAIKIIDEFLKLRSLEQRNSLVEQVIEKTGRGDVVRRLECSAMLQWDEIQLMYAAGIEIGAHSLTHPMLSSLDVCSVREEIVGSVERVKEMVGLKEVVFAYPYGGWAEVSDEVIDICRKSGASAAVLLRTGNQQIGDRFKIPRRLVSYEDTITLWGTRTIAVWACELEGIFDALRAVKVKLDLILGR